MKERAVALPGRCHCGHCVYVLEWPEPLERLPARRCGCSYCVRIDGVWTSHPAGRLSIRELNEGALQTYRFGTGTADFRFCGICAVTLFALCRIEGRELAVVNVHTLDLPQGVEPAVSDTDFEGESLEARLTRRARRWIGEVAWRS